MFTLTIFNLLKRAIKEFQKQALKGMSTQEMDDIVAEWHMLEVPKSLLDKLRK